jgi:hypothetical protein
MNTDNGEIRKFLPSEQLPGDPKKWVPLSYNEAEFLQVKGIAFRMIWAKKLARGLTSKERAQFDSLVASFHDTGAP